MPSRSHYWLPLIPAALFLIILPFPGTVAARLLFLAVAFLVALSQWWRYPEQRVAIPGIPVIVAWAIVCLLSLFYSVDPQYSAGELKNEIGYTMMAFFTFFALASDEQRARFLIRALALGFAVIGGWALAGWLANGFVWDETSRFGGIASFSTYLVTVLPALVWLALTDGARQWRRFIGGLLLLVFVLAVATSQRAVWPALAVETMVFGYWLTKPRMESLRKRHWLAATAIVCAFATAGLFLGEARGGGASAIAVHIADDVRFASWPAITTKIAEHPLAGAGFGRRAMAKAYPELIPDRDRNLWHAHNVFLNYGISMGVPGILVLVALFVWWGRYYWHAAENVRSCAGITGLALVAGVMTRNQFNDMFVRDMSLMFWALTGILTRLVVSKKIQTRRSSPTESH